MKKFILFIFLLGTLALTYIYRENIANYIVKFIKEDEKHVELVNNDYKIDDVYQVFTPYESDIINKKEDILNLYYTFLNSGMDEYTFYCNYEECMNDVDYASNDKKTLSYINNYIHPYNSFREIETTRYVNTNKVVLNVNHIYSKQMINEIDKKVDEILEEIQDNNIEYRIKKIHDYIINNAKYDSDRTDKNIIKYASDTAYGPLFEGYGVCNGYSDLMSIFLYKLGVKNIKISSENHIWNLVNIKDSWKHLDLTWDDPVNTESDKDILDYTYFLITTDELLEIKDDQHFFNKDIFKEAN